jgi:hypothetical protein
LVVQNPPVLSHVAISKVDGKCFVQCLDHNAAEVWVLEDDHFFISSEDLQDLTSFVTHACHECLDEQISELAKAKMCLQGGDGLGSIKCLELFSGRLFLIESHLLLD